MEKANGIGLCVYGDVLPYPVAHFRGHTCLLQLTNFGLLPSDNTISLSTLYNQSDSSLFSKWPRRGSTCLTCCHLLRIFLLPSCNGPFQVPALCLFPPPDILECSFTFLSELSVMFTGFLFTPTMIVVLLNSSIPDSVIMTQQKSVSSGRGTYLLPDCAPTTIPLA